MNRVSTPTDARELAFRSADGVDVSLLWHSTRDFVSVVVTDSRAGETFELVLGESDDAMDVFHHPYAYAAYRGVEVGVASPDPELVVA